MPFVFRGLLVPFSVLAMTSLNSIIVLISIFSCLSMFHTEIRIRYLLLYSGLSSIFLLKLFASSYFLVVGFAVVSISYLWIVLSSRKSRVELLLEELESTMVLKFALLINCVLPIGAIIRDYFQSLSTSNLYLSSVFCLLFSYVIALKVKRI